MVNNSSSFTITTMRRMNKRLYVWITTEHITTWTFATVDVLGMVTNLDKSAIEIMAPNLDKLISFGQRKQRQFGICSSYWMMIRVLTATNSGRKKKSSRSC